MHVDTAGEAPSPQICWPFTGSDAFPLSALAGIPDTIDRVAEAERLNPNPVRGA